MSIATPLAERVTLGKIVLLGTMFFKMPPISPTEHAPVVRILMGSPPLPMPILAQIGRIAPPVNIFIPTARATLTVYVVAVYRENIPPPPMLILVRTGKVV